MKAPDECEPITEALYLDLMTFLGAVCIVLTAVDILVQVFL
jgi:hypothetical protein